MFDRSISAKSIPRTVANLRIKALSSKAGGRGSCCFAFVCSDEKCCSTHTEKLEQSRLLVSYLTEAAIPQLAVIMQAASFFKVIPGDKRAGLRGEFLEDVRSYTGVFY